MTPECPLQSIAGLARRSWRNPFLGTSLSRRPSKARQPPECGDRRDSKFLLSIKHQPDQGQHHGAHNSPPERRRTKISHRYTNRSRAERRFNLKALIKGKFSLFFFFFFNLLHDTHNSQHRRLELPNRRHDQDGFAAQAQVPAVDVSISISIFPTISSIITLPLTVFYSLFCPEICCLEIAVACPLAPHSKMSPQARHVALGRSVVFRNLR